MDPMGNRKNKRIRPATLQEDLDAFAALQAIAGYAPNNADYALAKITTAKTSMQGNQTAEIQASAAANAKRDDTVSDEWKFHDLMLGAKDQIKSQFGANSNEYASLGLKKKSEYKTGRRKSGAGEANK